MAQAPASKLHNLLQEEGGFSVREDTGESPLTGYMVSQYGTEASEPGVASENAIEAYRSRYKPELALPGRFFGGWHDPEREATDLDVSHRFDKAPVAHEQGRRQAQRAYFDLQTFEDRQIQYGTPHPSARATGMTAEQHQGMRKELNELGRESVVAQLEARAAQPQTPEELRTVGGRVGEAVFRQQEAKERYRGRK